MALLLVLNGGPALAAGGAYAVDDADVDAPGTCKLEAWTSFARNGDFIGVAAPSCAFDFGRPVELGMEFERGRESGTWESGLILQFKTTLVPETGNFSAALSGGVGFDLIGRTASEWFVTVPVTIEFSEQFSLNLNAGWLHDQDERRNFATWGAGFEFSLAEPFALIGEVFGRNSETPATQIGLRYTPVEQFDFDVIYGRNLGGEHSNWITLGVNVRF